MRMLSTVAKAARVGLLPLPLLLGLAFVSGCGRSLGHVSVTLGSVAHLELDQNDTGPTSVQLSVGPRECRSRSVAFAWGAWGSGTHRDGAHASTRVKASVAAC